MIRKKAISNNIKYTIINQAVIFAVTFFLFPFIVSKVGKEIYGAYLLVMTFTGYLGVLDFGVGPAVVKYVAEFIGKKDNEGAKKVVSASASFYFTVGLISAVILVVLSFCFEYIFKIDPAYKEVVRHLFWVAAVFSVFVWTGRVFDGVIQGFQRYDLLAMINILFSVLTGISAFIIFNNGSGIVLFLAVSYTLIALKHVVFYTLSRFYFLKANIIFPYFDKKVFKMIFGFSIFLFLGNLANIIIFNFDNFVIGAFASVSAVTLYGVGYTLQNGFRMINSSIGTPLFPAGAHMEGRNEYDKQKELLFKGTKYITLLFIPMVIITIVFAKPFIINWMGPSFVVSILPAQALMLFWVFNNTIEVGSGLLVAKGYARATFNIVVLNALLNLVLSLLLVGPLGIVGVAMGTAIPMIFVSFPLILSKILKLLKVKLSEFFRLAVQKNLVVYLFAVVSSYVALMIFTPNNIFLTVGWMGVVYAIILFFGFVFALSKEERNELIDMVKF